MVCPSCGKRDADTPSGFCTICVIERAANRYAEADRTAAQQREDRWRHQSQRPDARLVLMRQHRSRAIARLRPKQDAPTYDPWMIALQALDMLKVVHDRRHTDELAQVAEALRRLAWGPDDDHPMATPTRPRRTRIMEGQVALWDAGWWVGDLVVGAA